MQYRRRGGFTTGYHRGKRRWRGRAWPSVPHAKRPCCRCVHGPPLHTHQPRINSYSHGPTHPSSHASGPAVRREGTAASAEGGLQRRARGQCPSHCRACSRPPGSGRDSIEGESRGGRRDPWRRVGSERTRNPHRHQASRRPLGLAAAVFAASAASAVASLLQHPHGASQRYRRDQKSCGQCQEGALCLC